MYIASRIAGLAAFVAVVKATATAAPRLDDNLSYQSPSLKHADLAIDTEAIHSKLVKRQLYYFESDTGNEGGPDNYLPELTWTNANYTGAISFTHGVASGDPSTDSVVLWTRAAPANNVSTDYPIPVSYQVALDRNFTQIVDAKTVYTTQDVDYTVKVLAQNLSPWTYYYYRFSAKGSSTAANATALSIIGRTKTLPRPDWDGTTHDMTLATFSCSNFPFGRFVAYGNAARRDKADLFVHLGDSIYEYARGEYDLGAMTDQIGRTDKPSTALLTLNDYRTRYKHYRTDEDFALALRRAPWVFVWDDHEVADNTWRGGSAQSNDSSNGLINGVDFTSRKAAAIRAYFEYTPIRPDILTNNLRLYRSLKLGKLADLFLLDTRVRDRDLTDLYYNTQFVQSIRKDQRRSLMGLEQEEWLYGNLRKSKNRGATWRILGQQIVMSELVYTAAGRINVDAWSGYVSNRARLFDVLSNLGDGNNVVLSGDSHIATAWSLNGTYVDKSYGPLGIELAGTAVSSPSPIQPRNATFAVRQQQNADLVGLNPPMAWADVGYRGYFELTLNAQKVNATFYATPDLYTPNNTLEITGPQLTMLKNKGLLQTPLNNGNRSVAFGVLSNTTAYRG
ncbi:hypothetical protein PYCC9005_005179 [Savitreella phatthalungensis]